MNANRYTLRYVSIILFFSLMLMLFSLLTSQSSGGDILGRWSIPMGILIVALLIIVFVTGVQIAQPLRFVKYIHPILSRIPNFASALIAILPPLVLFLIWFLFSVPLFQRRSFVIGVVMLSFSPGLITFALFEKARRKTVMGGTLLMLFSLTVGIVLGEIILRAVMPMSVFNPRFGLRPYQVAKLEVDLPGVTPGGTLSTNMWGFRGEDPPEQWDEYFTLVTAGGSTTANYYLDDALTWSHIIQCRLREVHPMTWVGNGGIPRHSSDTHLLFVREVLSQIKPDAVLFLVGVNDMGPFLRGSAGIVERLPDSGIRQTLFSKSMFLQLMYKLKKIYVDSAPVVTQSVDPTFREIPMQEEEAVLPEDLHDFLEDPEFYQRRIRLIIQECRSLGITPVFMTQPILYEDNDHWRGVQEGSQWLGGAESPMSAATFSLMLGVLNSDLMDVCAQEGIAVLDLASEIPHSRDYFYDSMHMTEAGAELVGEIAADFLLDIFESEELLWQED
ncbi:MAG: SGNH/GDSL hydrolase family protein [Candidatus Fermentibacteria bacterium]|nr:SGNH/GDSL hydrolase family protein [Candidatus Fermentibacteria bacterium]